MQKQRSPSTPRRVQEVIHHIQRLVQDGELQPGDRLPTEREIARQLQTSRVSVRIGIGYLASMGMMNVRRGVGTFLADGPPQGKNPPLQLLGSIHHFGEKQMLEARLVLGGAVAELAAERSGGKHARELAEELTEIYATVDSPGEFLAHEMRFHRLVAEASGNSVLAASMDMIIAVVFPSLRDTVQSPLQRRTAANCYHEMYKAIRERRSDDARRWMESLFKNSG